MPLTSACQLLITLNSKLLDQKDARKILDAEIDINFRSRAIYVYTHNSLLERIVISNARGTRVNNRGHERTLFKIYIIVSTCVHFFDCLRDNTSL